nr:putative ribonuclease H-like domain-containing protein [Tanacetum cinerariifolium]
MELECAKKAQIKLYKTREDNELDKVIELENKVKVLDNIVYKTGQSVQTMNMLNNKCRTSFAKPEFLKKAQRVNPRLYDIGCYNDNLALMLASDTDEVIRLEKESRSKLSDLIRPFDYDKLNNLYDLFVPQREKSSEQRYFSERSRLSHINVNNGKSKESFNKQTTLLEKRMDESIPLDKQCQNSLEIFKVKTYVNTIISGVCLNEEIVADLRYFNSLESKVDSLKSQLESQKTQFLNEIDQLSREDYYADHMNAILGHETELSKSKMMSNSFESVQKHAINLELELQQYLKAQLQDKGIVISELKKLIEKLKGKSVDTKFEKSSVIRQSNAFKSQRPSVLGKPTTFSNSFVRKDFSKSTLNAKTLNVKSVCATLDTCVLNNKHDMCVLNSVAKPNKKTVSSESNKKPRNFTRKLYERVSKTCNWWYSKFTPSGYKWKPKPGKENVNPNLVEIVLFIVDFGCSKHMTGNLKLLINFIEKKSTCFIRDLKGNDLLTEGILHQTSVARTPKQNGFVERQNRTLVEAARTMLSAAKVPLFFWDEAIATTCFTQNHSLVIPRHEKTPYHIINDRKLSVKFFHIFGSICYIVKDGENLNKMKEKDQLSFDPTPECQTMALNHDSLSPAIQRQANVPQADRTVTTLNELDLLFSSMFDELLNGSSKVVSKSSAVSAADAPNHHQHHTNPLNNHTTPEPTCQVTNLAPTVISSENINQAETYAENDQVADGEFINIFSTPIQDQWETSS